jgi:hypothetical protein
MTDIQHIDVDSDEFEGTPRALRDYAKKLQKALETVSKERDGFRDQVTSGALGNVLTGFKNPERVKSALLTDKVDPLDSEAVSKWIEENGDDYAKAEANPNPVATEQPSPDEAAFAALQLGNAYRPAGDLTKLDAMIASLPPDATPEQVASAARAAGI